MQVCVSWRPYNILKVLHAEKVFCIINIWWNMPRVMKMNTYWSASTCMNQIELQISEMEKHKYFFMNLEWKWNFRNGSHRDNKYQNLILSGNFTIINMSFSEPPLTEMDEMNCNACLALERMIVTYLSVHDLLQIGLHLLFFALN